MKAIVLAAGYGTRMRTLSEHLPKPLMPVAGRPLLWHTITKLARSKADAVGVNAHHLAGLVQAYIAATDFGVPVTVSHEPEILGSGGGIAGFRGFLDGEDYFLVHNGDMLSDIDIAAAHASYCSSRPLCAMVLRDAPGFNNVCVDDAGRIVDLRDVLRFGGAVRRLAYTGICFLRGDILSRIPAGGSDLIVTLLEVIRRGGERVEAIIAGDRAWRDVGSPESYLDGHRDILVKKLPLIDPALIPQGSVCTGPVTQTGEGVELAGFVSIGRGCRLGSGSRLEDCVVWDGVEIPPGASFKNAVIGPGWVVRPGQEGRA